MSFRNGPAFTPRDIEAALSLIDLDGPIYMPRSGPQTVGPTLVEIGASSSRCHLLSMVFTNERVDERMPKRSEYSARLGGHEYDPTTNFKADTLDKKIANARYPFI